MGDQNMTDFVVDSNGLCFLCLNKIKSQFPAVTSEDKSPPVHSLQYLSRYLKLDMTRVFNETDAITPELLAKVERSRLKVQLCEDCTSINDTFSKLYRQLQKVEMRVKSFVKLIKNKLSNVDKNSKGDYQFGINSANGFNGKLRIMEVLRTEAEEKCSSKLGAEPPRIKLQNLSLKQVQRKTLKIKSSCPLKTPTKGEGGGVDDAAFENVSDGNMDIRDFNSRSPDLVTANDDNDNGSNSHFENYDDNESNGRESEQVVRNYVTVEQEGTGTPTTTTKPTITIDKSVYTISSETGKYKCNLCAKELNNFACFKRHYEGLHLKIRYKCSMCGKEFLNKRNYMRHVQTTHLGVRFKCQACGKIYSQQNDVKRHQRLTTCGVGVTLSVKHEAVS